jgi:putative hydrolase of the HAD superfamily
MNLFIFDGDDTLWDTQPMYIKAIDEFLDVAEGYGFARNATRDYLTKLNLEYVGRHGLGQRYFGNVTAKSLRKLVRAGSGEKWTKELARQVIDIGNQIYTTIPDELPGLIPALQQVYTLGRVHILTAGHTAVQMAKYEGTAVSTLSDNITIVERKTSLIFPEIMRKYDATPETTWMIGNSVRSDMLPADKAGLNLLWFQRKTWIYDEVGIEQVSRPMQTAKSLSEVAWILTRYTSKAKVSA